RSEARQAVAHQVPQARDRRRRGDVQASKLYELAAQFVLRLVPKVLVRDANGLERVAPVEHDARALHLVELYRENVRRVVQLREREVDGERVAEPPPHPPRPPRPRLPPN